MVSAGMDLEKPRPLQVLVGVLTSVTTGFFSIAALRVNEDEEKVEDEEEDEEEEAEEEDGVCFTFQISGLQNDRHTGS